MGMAYPCGLYTGNSYRSKTENCECTMKSLGLKEVDMLSI